MSRPNQIVAFSLIELLVTITIIGILSSISIALYSQYRHQAYNAHAVTLALNARTALEVYRGANPDLYTDILVCPNGEVKSCAVNPYNCTDTTFSENLVGLTMPEDMALNVVNYGAGGYLGMPPQHCRNNNPPSYCMHFEITAAHTKGNAWYHIPNFISGNVSNNYEPFTDLNNSLDPHC